ncbi:phage virion morphogenesis protein [Mycolicibacterium sp. S3B2]|uniref:phage virion morphogenesis protein n=1 Tax=Mycolicibacterium sp. S3B2 TaxID=3415120 RepID=UPI003C7D9B26
MADSLDMKLEVKGDEQVKQMLTSLGLDLRNLRGAMNEVGRSQMKYFIGNVFASRGATINGGQRWQRLNDKYAARKAKTYPGRPILVATGKMQNSFKYSSTGMSVEIYNTDPKFKYHQSSETRYVIPRRVMLGVYSGMQRDVTATIAKVISEKIRRGAG